MTAVGALALALGEWYAADRFFATGLWKGGVLLLAAAWQAGTGVLVGLILLVGVLTVHAREQKTLALFLSAPVEKKTVRWRRCTAAFARYMIALAIVSGGLGVLV